MEVLETVGRAHPLALQSPAPQAFFIEFADSAITFELRVWCQFEGSGKVQTDLALAAYAALREADMSIPLPQREVRMMNGSQTALTGPPAAPAVPDRPNSTGM